MLPVCCFVNDSGSRKQCVVEWPVVGKLNLPFFFSWPIPPLRLLYNVLGVTVRFVGLKEETEARLDKAVEIYGIYKCADRPIAIFVSGRQEDYPEAPNSNRLYLLRKGIPEGDIYADGYSLDTRGNVEQFLTELKKCYPGRKTFDVMVTDSCSRMPRTCRILRELSETDELNLRISQWPAVLTMSWRNFKEGTLFAAFREVFQIEVPALRNILLKSWRKTKKQF